MNKDYFNKTGLWLCVSLVLLFTSACSYQAAVPVVKAEHQLLKARYGHAAVQDGKRIFIIAGSDKTGLLSDIEVYDPLTGHIEHWKGKLIPRRYFSAVWDGNESVYILGGVSVSAWGSGLESRVEVLNTRTGEVTFAPNLPVPTLNNTAVFSDGRIVVFGGSRLERDMKVSIPVVAIYDLSERQWFRAKDMPTPKDTKAVVKDEWIYLVGGYNRQSALNSFERFNPTTNEWQVLPPLPVKLSAHSVTVMQNQLLAFGDYENMKSTYSYDFDKAQWQKLELGYKASRHNAAVTFDDDVYVFGGTIGGNGPFLNYIQKFSF